MVKTTQGNDEDCNNFYAASAAPLSAHRTHSAPTGSGRPSAFGPYRVLRLIGGGGAGWIYLCRTGDGSRVAVKVAGPAAGIECLRRESAACAAISHPNVVRVVGSYWVTPSPYLALEYIDGQSFRQLVQANGPIPARLAAEYGRQTACGLSNLHAAGWVHRDIKPSNLMCTRTGQVKLIDFGGSARFDVADNPSSGWGSVLSLAPDLARRPNLTDPRSDVYGLGAVLYYLLTGRSPSPDGTDAGLFLWALTADARPAPRLGRRVPAELAMAVRRMLAPDPAHRHPSAAAVAEVLSGWQKATSRQPK